MPQRLLLACLILLLLAIASPIRLQVSAGTESPAFLYTVTQSYEPLAWMHGGDRFNAGANIFLHDTKGRHSLLPNFVASADPAVSFDGARALFSGRQRAGDPWQIWEISFSGEQPRRVVSTSDNCVRPFYLAGKSDRLCAEGSRSFCDRSSGFSWRQAASPYSRTC